MARIRDFHATLIESREIAPEIRHFVFTTPEPFTFTPGQFVYLRAEINGAAVKRAYSLASAPGGTSFELCLNRVCEGVFSPYLFDLEPGAVVPLQGPYGVFGWRKPARDSVLVATGTGIAPFRSMLRAGLPESGDVTLLFGVRYEESILYRAEFEALAAAEPRFRFWPTLSRPGPGWSARAGRVQAHLDEAVAGRDVDVYICGLSGMVQEVRDMLLSRGLEKRRIIYERYD